MSFSKALVRVKLSSMDLSQASINGVSQFLIENCPSKLDESLTVWEHEFRQGNLQYRKLLLYVANDMILLASQHQDLIKTSFAKPLELAFWLLAGADGGVDKKIERLPSVWRERNIFHISQIDRFTGILDGTAPQPLEFMEIEQPQSINEDLDPKESQDTVVLSLVSLKKRDVASTLGEDAVQSAQLKIRQLVANESSQFNKNAIQMNETNDGEQYEIMDVNTIDVKKRLLLHREKLMNTVNNRKSIVEGLKELQNRLKTQISGGAAKEDKKVVTICSILLERASQAWDDVGSLVTAQAKRQREQDQALQGIPNHPLPSTGPPLTKRPRYNQQLQQPPPTLPSRGPPSLPSSLPPSLPLPLSVPLLTHPQQYNNARPARQYNAAPYGVQYSNQPPQPPPLMQTSSYRQPPPLLQPYPPQLQHRSPPKDIAPYRPQPRVLPPPQQLQQQRMPRTESGRSNSQQQQAGGGRGMDINALSDLLSTARNGAVKRGNSGGMGRGKSSTLPAWMTEGK